MPTACGPHATVGAMRKVIRARTRGLAGTDRRGGSLIEVMVALLVLAVGLLELARAAGGAIAVAADARLRGAAARTASRRIELLRAAGCTAASGSAIDVPGLTEWWSARVGDGWIELRDSVGYRSHAGRRAVVIVDRGPC